MQENGVHEAEHRRIRTDPQRQRENHHGGEAGILEQATQGVFDVVNDSTHFVCPFWVVGSR